MKKLLKISSILFLSLAIFSCSKRTQDSKLIDSLNSEFTSRINNLNDMIDSLEHEKFKLKHENFNLENFYNQINRDVILVEVTNDKYLNWDNCKYEIVKDKFWIELKKDYLSNKVEYIELIEDTTNTDAYICGLRKNLVKGDIAFLIIDEVDNIPLFSVFDIQFDVFDNNCKYPNGLFSSLNKKRSFFKSKLL